MAPPLAAPGPRAKEGMKVQTKIILLLVAVVAAFVTALVAATFHRNAKFDRIARERAVEREVAFREFLQRRGEPLETLVKDFTTWDGMVRALRTHDRDWVAKNLGDAPLTTYHANAVWILHRDLAPYYSHDNLYTGELASLPFPRDAVPRIFAERRQVHFFVKTRLGYLEVRGATIHGSQDSDRSTPPQGYLFAGRLWSNEFVREMGVFTGNEVRLVPAESGPPRLEPVNPALLAFSTTLSGFDGQPLAHLVVQNSAPFVAELYRHSDQLLVSTIVFALVVLVFLSFALVRWVSAPLRLISDTLNKKDTAPLLKLTNNTSEFGKMAQLIRHFFEQRAVLLEEMQQHKAAREALERSEEQLRQSMKMEAIGRLAGGVAHDFNNLLTAILGYSTLLVERLAGDRFARQAAEQVHRAGEQAAGLTRQLLAFSRKQVLQPRVIDLNALIASVEKLLRRLIGEHIDLRTIADAFDARVKADPGQIEQVLLNLAVNSRDAMPTGGVITIRTANVTLDEKSSRVQAGLPTGEYVVIAVTDTGQGMDKGTRERIFEPFFTTKAPGHGTGLGLATVYGIVKQSGGGISVESAPGRGTSFRIYLPLERSPVEAAKTHAPSVDTSLHSETILVVEDEEIVRRLVCDVLQKSGYRVICAERGSEAVKACAEHEGPIQLLITDVIMPEQSGQEVARQVCAMRHEARVLYISGYSDTEITLSIDSDIEFLAKPFTPQALNTRVREILDKEPAWETAGAS